MAAKTKDITLNLGPENKLQPKGLNYLQGFASSNVFFHVTTAYNILRNDGVDLGKKDFIGG